MKKNFILFCILFLTLYASASHKVYLLHGFGNSRAMMRQINKTLQQESINTENIRYRSMVTNLDSLGKELYLKVKSTGTDSVSFVTFSMGGLVVRSMLQYAQSDSSFPAIYRIVMVAPPNKGAEVADFYSSFKFFNLLLGPNVTLMRTDSGSYVNRLPIPQKAEIGIIAGATGKKRGYNIFIDNDNDGFLSTDRTQLGVEKERVIINSDHATITRKKVTQQLISHFIKQGTFNTEINTRKS